MSSSKTLVFLSFFQAISYKNLVITRQIYFLRTFLKSWVHVSDDIAGVVGDPQY